VKTKENPRLYAQIIGKCSHFLLDDIPGALVDGGSGKGYDYQNYLVNPLSCK
jgi:hypothetical protein